MASKAEEIINKHKGSMDYIGGNTIEMYKDNLFEAMKEIASIGFNEGVEVGGMNPSYIELKKRQFIDNLFNNELP